MDREFEYPVGGFTFDEADRYYHTLREAKEAIEKILLNPVCRDGAQ